MKRPVHHCLVCGSFDINYRTYGEDPQIAQVACFEEGIMRTYVFHGDFEQEMATQSFHPIEVLEP